MMQPQFAQWLAERIRSWGLSQRGLADRLDVNRSVVSRWLRGAARPSAANCAKLAQVLETPVQEVLDAVGYASPPTVDPEVLPEEQQLLTNYRRLSPGYRELLQLMARELADLGSSGSAR